MTDETVNPLTDTDLPELCPACLDRQRRFEKNDAINNREFRIGHIHGGMCSRCVYRRGASK